MNARPRMTPKASPAFAPPDMPPDTGSAVGVALVPKAALAPGVEATCDVAGVAVMPCVGGNVVLKTELLVSCESDEEICGAEELAVSACSVAVGAEDSVCCGSWVAGSELDGVSAAG